MWAFSFAGFSCTIAAMEDTLRQAITDALKQQDIEGVDFTIEHPTELSHGDYASNVALVAAKAAGIAPQELAHTLAAKLSGQIENVANVEVAGPGFINFHLTREFFVHKVHESRERDTEWGCNESLAGTRVVVEYTDPNPFKEFHIGHLFTNSVGEAIARLFMANGATTMRVNYQGDVGLHVACALWGMQELGYAGAYDFTPSELGKAYVHGATEYKENEAVRKEIIYLNKAIYEGRDETLMALYRKGREVSLRYFEGIYHLIDTHFDEYFFESEAGERGKELVLAHPEIFPESDGARVFRGEEYDLHTRVFLNSEGLPTYEAKELALAKLKDERLSGYDHSVIVTANEINEYFRVLLKAMELVFPELSEKTEHLGHGTVRLASGKMSSRTGEVIAALDFIDEIAEAANAKMQESGRSLDKGLATDIAIAAIKYATLKADVHKDSVFDKEQALSFEGDSGPYLQYTHARINSVLENAAAVGVRPRTEVIPASPFTVERLLYRFPEVVARALRERSPHQVAGYLIELAGAFNTFYATERIADPEDEFAPYKAAVADAVRITLKNGLSILAIRAPEQI